MSIRSSRVHEVRDDSRTNVAPMSVYNEPERIILLLDIDCFEVQVWMQKQMYLFDSDKPMVVTNSNGKILSVNYMAKSMGVKRGEGRQWLEDARALCLRAGTQLVEIIPGQRYGKRDSFTPITESNRILDAIISWAKMKETETEVPIKIERTFRDDFYMDLTDLVEEKIDTLYENNPRQGQNIVNPWQEEINVLNRLKEHPCQAYDGTPTICMEGRTRKIVGEKLCRRVQKLYDDCTYELRLVHGAVFADSIIQHIHKETGYNASAGVAHSKLVAKLACGLNKPRGICIVPEGALPRLSKTMRFQDLPGFGGKTGNALQSWISSKLGKNTIYIYDIHRAVLDGINLSAVFQEMCISNYEAKAKDLYNKCRFKDKSPVTSKVHPDMISILFSFEEGGESKVEFDEGVLNISKDMEGRIDYYRRIYRRTAKKLRVKFDSFTNARTRTGPYNSPSKSLPQDTAHFVSHESIRDFILERISSNGLYWTNIWNIHLTARYIPHEEVEEIGFLSYARLRNCKIAE